MQPNLPPELLDHIFTFLRESSDLPSLRACSHVNPTFFSLTERHIYHHLTLTNLHTYESLSNISSPAAQLSPAQLMKLLTDEPHIAGYVRSLRITIATLGILRWFMTRSLNDEDIARVLPLLPALERIALTDRGTGRGGKIPWTRLQRSFQVAFVQALRLPSVREVAIKGIDGFPLALLNGSPSLVNLSLLGNFSYKGPTDPPDPSFPFDTPPTTFSSRARLTSLTLQHCTPSLPSIVAWLVNSEGGPDISHLTYLKATVQRIEDYEHLQTIISACSGSLRELELDPGSEVNLLYTAQNQIDPLYPNPAPTHNIIPLPPTPQHPHPIYNPLPLPTPTESFNLSPSSLPSLKQLTLKLTVETIQDFWIDSTGEEAVEEVVYSTPFEWVGRVLEKLTGSSSSSGVPLPLSASASSASGATGENRAQTQTQSQSQSQSGSGSSGLEVLTLDISFKIDPYSLQKIDWDPLASSLSRTFRLLPSLKSVQIRAISGSGGSKSNITSMVLPGLGGTMKTLVEVLEEDVCLRGLVRDGLVRVVVGK